MPSKRARQSTQGIDKGQPKRQRSRWEKQKQLPPLTKHPTNQLYSEILHLQFNIQHDMAKECRYV